MLMSSSVRARRVRAVLMCACGAAVGLAGVPSAFGAAGTWNSNSSGNWSDTTKWNGGIVADGAGSTASFVVDIDGGRTVTLDSARTIGGLVFTDATNATHDWTLSGTNTLTLDGTSPVTISVTNRTATINTVLTTVDGDVVQKTSGGTLVLTAQNLFANGYTQTAGATRIGADSTVTGGVITSGPVGTGTLTLSAGTFQDSGVARTLQNNLSIGGSVTFSSSGSGSLTFNSAGLTTPSTIAITTANPTVTVSNTTTFTNVISSANGFTKAGTGRLNVTADNSSTWTAAGVTSSGGVLAFTSLNAMPNASGRVVTAAAGGAVTLGGAALTQAFVDKVALGSAGVIAIDAATSNSIDFTGFTGGVRLGASGSYAFTGVHTPADPSVYRLGGGGGTLSYNSAITGATTSVNIGNNGNTTGAVVLGNAANDFQGGITVDSGVLVIDTADGTAAGGAAKLGQVPATPAVNITLTNGGLLRWANTTGTINTNRQIALGTGGGGIDTNGQSISFGGPIVVGGNTFTKTGTGTLTLTTNYAFATVNVNGGTLATSASQSFSTGSLNIGQNGTTGTLTVAGGTSFTLGGGATTDLNIGTRGDGVDRATTGTLNLAAATGTNTINVNNLRVLVDYSATASNGIMNSTLTFPTAAAAITNVNAANAFIIGNSPGEGGNGTAAVNLGGGTVNVNTPTLTVGGQKASVNLTSAAGSVLTVNNGGSGRTTLNVGNNNASNTGTAPTTTLNLTNTRSDLLLGAVLIANRPGGGAGDSVATMTISNNANNVFDASSSGQTLLIGRVDGGSSGVLADGTLNYGGGNGTITGTSAANVPLLIGRHTGTFASGTGTAKGLLNITGGAITVNSAANNAIVLASGDSTVTSTGAAITGTLTINGGSLTVNKSIVHGGGSTGPTYTSTVNLQAGLLDLDGNGLTNISAINFTGGTLRDVGTLARTAGLTQNGATSVLEVLGNNTSFSGPYTITSGTTAISTQRNLSIAGALDLSGVNDTLLINDAVTQLTGGTITLASFTSLVGGAHYDSVKYFDGVSTITLTDAQATTQGNLPNNYVLQYSATDIQLVQVPEPAALSLLAMTGIGLLGRRRRNAAC